MHLRHLEVVDAEVIGIEHGITLIPQVTNEFVKDVDRASMVTDVVLNKMTKRQKRQQIKGLQHRWCAYILLQSCLFGLNWSISSIL